MAKAKLVESSNLPTLRAVPVSNGQAHAEVVLVTPAMASALLAKNPKNRNIKAWRVKAFTETMQRGEWQLNNDAIGLNAMGELLNGQHRLTAVVTSGLAQSFLIAYGLTDESQLTMDIGQRRNYADHLVMQGGVKHAGNLTVGLRVLHYYLRAYARGGTNGDFMSGYGNNAAKPSFQQLDTLLAQVWSPLQEGVSAASKAILRSKSAPALHGGVGAHGVGIFLAREGFADRNRDPQDFERGLFTGAELSEGDPRLLLRAYTRLTNGRGQSGYEVLAYLHTVNTWFEQGKRQALRIQDRGPLTLPFGRLPSLLQEFVAKERA
jgi:hypothetical protein